MNGQEHINYSAADIERYHKGSMTAMEMHALEKAALDDPFLADALEGYISVPVNQSEDISILEKKLDERINKKEKAKVVPLKNSKLPWLRIAALFIVIAGAGLITYQFVLTGKYKDVAKSEVNDISKINPQVTDTSKQVPVEAETKSDTSNPQKLETLTSGVASDKTDNLTAAKKVKPVLKQADQLTTDKEIISQPGNAVSAAPKADDKKIELQNESLKKPDVAVAGTTNAKQEADKTAGRIIKDTGYQYQKEFKTKELNEASVSRNFSLNNAANIFRGQVLDANNNPLPFANVINIQDNVGTYTDAKGYFTLVSPDSALNVQVHSVGFENNIARLKNNTTSNNIVLQQDTKNITATVMSNRKINTERTRQNNMILEEPEPSDGWYNYDTYIANNIEIPDEVKTKNGSAGEVELSFAINKDGEPIDIKVEKSVCKECDAEAIRLLKEGPKWKKKKKNARAKVAVAF
ncbi:MAG: carboxypeptidase-like regulatory domain-containing protein [Bacteroidota bacterium]